MLIIKMTVNEILKINLEKKGKNKKIHIEIKKIMNYHSKKCG